MTTPIETTNPAQGNRHRCQHPGCGEAIAAYGHGWEHLAGPHDHPATPVTLSPNPALDPARLREFAFTVEQTLAAPDLSDVARLARIAVAHARLTQGRAER